MGTCVASRVAHLTAAEAEKLRALIALAEEASRAVKALDDAWALARVPDLPSGHIAGAEASLTMFYVAAVERLAA